MGRSDWYKSGDWNAECEVCGQKYKMSKLRKRWDGLMVCPKDWEPRHPQDFVKGVRDNQSVPVSRPEAPDAFVEIDYTLSPQIQDPSHTTVNVTDSVTSIANYIRGLSDTETIVDSAALITGYNRSLADSAVSGDTVVLLINANRAFAESVVEIDSIISFSLISGNSLNGAALNEIPLG